MAVLLLYIIQLYNPLFTEYMRTYLTESQVYTGGFTDVHNLSVRAENENETVQSLKKMWTKFLRINKNRDKTITLSLDSKIFKI